MNDETEYATGGFIPRPQRVRLTAEDFPLIPLRDVDTSAVTSPEYREWMESASDDARPPWAEGDMPDIHKYVESELFVARSLSTMPPFSAYHPAWALPFARNALEALDRWVPSDAS